ncbi:hypothetical protein [Streptomyces sp. TS71-3]|uniref:hypothetical protein n=1 Tax=Streptomyces sp. TS71-3 TaxID=2733862 RepID=UPI001B0FBF26|nr:hypothetical protein [Streptomyces sp. TS71-3]GHJ40512.1 hypothetical protein Sm713_61210 [Streptomyces sp. TS71-3]
MTTTLERPAVPTTRDPREILNAVAPHVTELTANVLESGMSIWDREVALLLRDHTMVRDMAERILGNAVMYVLGSIEHRDVHLGVGRLVDVGVRQLILDTPVWWGICRLYNGGRFKHHAPFIQRRPAAAGSCSPSRRPSPGPTAHRACTGAASPGRTCSPTATATGRPSGSGC